MGHPYLLKPFPVAGAARESLAEPIPYYASQKLIPMQKPKESDTMLIFGSQWQANTLIKPVLHCLLGNLNLELQF